jgi:prepilin-type N-terminal cleavage/methylation domain-containing protein
VSKRHLHHAQQAGFALLEVIVALAIMALVGLMAWRGMDAMIRGREIIDRRANQDANYTQLVQQFERDCQSVLGRDEISGLASTVSNSASASTVSAIAAGAKNIWFLRRYRADNLDAWLVAGYGMGPTGLQRWTSRPLLQRNEAAVLWLSVTRDPDLSSGDLLVSLDVPMVVRQTFALQTLATSGAGGGGISATGTGSPPPAPVTPGAAGTPPAAPTPPVTVSNLLPAQQGIVMQWWLKDIALPITRSCLLGGAL